jgi:hypothetical protein
LGRGIGWEFKRAADEPLVPPKDDQTAFLPCPSIRSRGRNTQRKVIEFGLDEESDAPLKTKPTSRLKRRKS